MQKTTFALYYGNRGMFPASLMAGAQEELPRALRAMGHEVIELDRKATRFGAVETRDEGRKYAAFLAASRGAFQGVILSLPNFGDENGAVEALRDAGVPILIQAYPDELDKMSPTERRDSFCGKLSVMDVFRQYGVKFTALAPHTVHPASPRFRENVEYFDRLCRVVAAGRRMTVGAIGARTTPFKTVRIDELTLERHGITVETVDLSEVFSRMKGLRASSNAYKDARKDLAESADWQGVPEAAIDNLARLLVVLETLVAEYSLDAMSIRCWNEIQSEMRISPCVVNGLMSDRGVPVACEVDTGSAVTMRLLAAASHRASTVLDWNNNYGDDDERCILFHCGNAPRSLMAAPGHVTDHAIIATGTGPGRGWGCSQGRFAPGAFTFGDLMADSGAIHAYLGEGSFSSDPISKEFFGVAGVARVKRLQEVLLHIGRSGHRHHVAIAPGSAAAPMREAMESYLGYTVSLPQG